VNSTILDQTNSPNAVEWARAQQPEAVVKRVRKPRKKKAQLIAEAFEAGRTEGREESAGGLAVLVVGAFSGAIGTLMFIALYHYLHG
jgi:hypothetical protein